MGFSGSAAVRGDKAKAGSCPGGCWMFGLDCVMAGLQLEGQAVVVWVWLAGVEEKRGVLWWWRRSEATGQCREGQARIQGTTKVKERSVCASSVSRSGKKMASSLGKMVQPPPCVRVVGAFCSGNHWLGRRWRAWEVTQGGWVRSACSRVTQRRRKGGGTVHRGLQGRAQSRREG